MESGVWVQQRLDDILVLIHCPASVGYGYTSRMASFVPPPLMMPLLHLRRGGISPLPHHGRISPLVPRGRWYEVPPRIRARLIRIASAAADASFDHNDAVIQPQKDAHNLNRRVENTLSQDYISDFLLSHRGTLTTKEEIICTICQDEINEEEIVTLNCRHSFHANCIKNWLMIKNQCANCRVSAIPDEYS